MNVLGTRGLVYKIRSVGKSVAFVRLGAPGIQRDFPLATEREPSERGRDQEVLLNLISFLHFTKCACMLSHFSHVQFFATLWTVACQAPLSMGFSRQEQWSGFPSPTLGDLPYPEIKPATLLSPALWGRFFSSAATWIQFSSVQFSRSVVPNSLRPHGLQHARLLCPSPTLGACSNSCPSSRWCHPTISSSVIHFFSCLQSFPASGPFPMSQLFALAGQSTGVSASASVLPMNTQDWFPLGCTGWISLPSKGLSKASNTTAQKHQFLGIQLSQSSSHSQLGIQSHIQFYPLDSLHNWFWIKDPSRFF